MHLGVRPTAKLLLNNVLVDHFEAIYRLASFQSTLTSNRLGSLLCSAASKPIGAQLGILFLERLKLLLGKFKARLFIP